MHIPETLAHIGNVMSFIDEDGPDVFEVENIVHKKFEILAVTEEA